MKTLNDKIRHDISKSYQLRKLAKDDKITPKKRNELYEAMHKNDKKIRFLKNLNNALKEIEK